MTQFASSDHDYEYEGDDEECEVERNGEFGRTNEKLGSGAYKIVYRGIDHERGIEVAWNQLRISQSQNQKYLQEIQMLQTLQHPNIIKFYNSWIDKNETIVFITEWMSSGNLKQFTKERYRANQENLKPVKNWCRQILRGLNYLHTRNPPIIHRDIKCDNIFLDATSGCVKIGDLGLARELITSMALTVIGTPEFMAPEFYNEHYTEKVDIWAFGMSVVEMVTGTTPYSGLNPVQIYKKVTEMILPKELELITNPELREFIMLCLREEATRPSAQQLLDHLFLQEPTEITDDSNSTSNSVNNSNNAVRPVQAVREVKPEEVAPLPSFYIKVFRSTITPDPNSLAFVIEYVQAGSEERIEFSFDKQNDTPTEVVSELVEAMSLSSFPQTMVDELTALITKAAQEGDFYFEKN